MAAPDKVPNPTPAPKSEPESILVPEEIDSAKWSMPPWGVVGVVLLVIFIGIGIVSYVMRPKPRATGTIDEIYAVATADNKVMATVKVTIHNVGGRMLYIRNIKATANTDQGPLSDDAANAVDFPRYFQAYPDLREHTITPLKAEDRIRPGEQARGSVMVSFPITMDQFNARKSLAVTVEPYDQPAFTLAK